MFVALLAALAGWTGLSAVWSDDSTLSLLELERALVYVAALGAALFLLERERVPALLGGIVVAVAALSVAALADRPDVGSLEGPVGYANALGILCVLALLLLLGSRRPLAAALAIPLAVALVLTGSRGSWVALAAGLAVAAVIRFGRRALGPLALVALVAVVALAARPLDLGDRPYYWRAALRQYAEAPLLGTGAGTFQLHWPALRPHDLSKLDTPDVLDAHSLYLETLAELGPLGLALVAAVLGVPLVALARRRDRMTSALAPPYAAFLVHVGLDWDWEMPAVTLTGLACGAGALVAARDRVTELRWRARLGLLTLAAGLAVFAAFRFDPAGGPEEARNTRSEGVVVWRDSAETVAPPHSATRARASSRLRRRPRLRGSATARRGMGLHPRRSTSTRGR